MLEMRTMIAIALLLVCSYTDIKEKNIYLLPVGIAGGLGVVISIYQSISYSNIWSEIALKWIFLPIIGGAILYSFATIAEEMIGRGDILLILAIGLIMGISVGAQILLMAFVFAGIFCLFLLIIGKMSNKEGIPFAPFMLLSCLYMLVRG